MAHLPELTEDDFLGPPGLGVRGTVLVIPGRGDNVRSYARFATRLAADAYRVRVLSTPELDVDDFAGSLDRLADQITEAIAELESFGALARPLVLVGADSGAAAVGALVARNQPSRTWWPQAVILAGLPGYGPHEKRSWNDELDDRTRCPVHRRVLSEDAGTHRGTLADAIPVDLLDAVYGSTVDLPHLLLVGDCDRWADPAALIRTAQVLPRARLTQVRGANHDVLNDLQHRSVAAEVISFLEALRDEPPLVPVVTVETSAW